jgi:CyaY protein
MIDSTYQQLADRALKAITDAFDDVDPELVDCDTSGDVITLVVRGAQKFVINTQRSARQIWLAANATAWHFSWDEAGQTWLDDKGRGDLFVTLSRLVREGAGVDVSFS